jgi:quercetin dioxygenase-like cupin family protein
MEGSPRHPDEGPILRAGDVIHDPVHGETMRFLHVGGGNEDPVLRVEMTVEPQASGPPAHIHPRSEERFEVRAGAIRLRMRREDRVISAGEVASVEPRTPHTFSNPTDEPAVILTEWRPGLGMAGFLDKWFELARSGQLNSKGLPSLLQTAVLFDAYLESIALPALPFGLQRMLFRGLGRLGRRRGYTSARLTR